MLLFFYRYLSIWIKDIRFFSFPDKIVSINETKQGELSIQASKKKNTAHGFSISPSPMCNAFSCSRTNKYGRHNFIQILNVVGSIQNGC